MLLIGISWSAPRLICLPSPFPILFTLPCFLLMFFFIIKMLYKFD